MKRLSHKIWLGIMVVVLLLCVLILGFQRYFLEDLYLERLTSSVGSDVYEVLDGFDADNSESAYFRLDALAYRRNISVEVIDQEGKTIYVTGEDSGIEFENMDVKKDVDVLFLKNTVQNPNESKESRYASVLKIIRSGDYIKERKEVRDTDDEKGVGEQGTGVGQDTGDGQGTDDRQRTGEGQGADDGQGTGEGQGTGDGQGAGDDTGDREGSGDQQEAPGSVSDTVSPESEENYQEFQFIPEGENRESIVDDTHEGNEVIIETIHPKYGFRLLVFSVAFTSEQGNPYTALIGIPLTEIDEIVELISIAIFISIVFILFVAGIASYVVSMTISKPLRELNKAAESIGSGDLEARVEMKSKDEVGNLGRTFNAMAGKLQKADKMKKEFVENVSHELRTPISVIRGYAEIIRDVTGENKGKREKQLDVISDEANRLGFMVNDILDYSRMTSEGIELDIVEFDIDALIGDLVNKYRILLHDSNIKIEYDSKGLLQVKGDKNMLGQAIENLIRNAINYSPEGGSVKVIMSKRDRGIYLEIRDQGIGIPMEEQPMIWERYYRTKGIKKRKILGSGLGLSIVKNILEAHSAVYGVNSKQGIGTTFWFELPDNI